MPSRYPVEVALAEEHHWTLTQIHEMPADYVDEMYTRLRSRYKWEAERDRRDKARANAKKNKSKSR
ncbi:MAG: hypothetical protein KDK05_07860 [Candidatus Competibacteraceae bacterium]|nr:hypothetical protein [Candidatus Competibacteraceae bacterium]